MSDRKAIIMSALDFSRLDQDFIRIAVFAAFCADYIISGESREEETPKIYRHPVTETLCFWSDDRQQLAVAPDTPVKVVFKTLELTIERLQAAQKIVDLLVATNRAAFKS